MTEQLDPQFQIFSEMLDNEEALGESALSVMGKDGAVLLGLRQHLRDEAAAPSLPQGFARSTAAAIEQRLVALPTVVKGLVRLEPALRSGPLSRNGLPWTFAGTLLGLSAAAISWKAVVLFGTLTLVFGVSAGALFRRYLPHHLELPEVWHDEASTRLARLFYALPVASILITSLVGGLALARLGEISLSFQSNSTNLKVAGAAGTLIVAAWLLNAFWPVWRAYEEATRGRTLRTMMVQGLHALWIWVMSFLLLDSFDLHSGPVFLKFGWWPEWLLLGLTGLAVVATWRLSGRRAHGARRYPLTTAFRRLLAGLMIGAVPMVLTFMVFYQASLTREIIVGPQYEEMRHYVEQWQAGQKAIRPEDNGMTELEPILYAKKGSNESAARLGGAGDLLLPLSERRASPEAMEKSRREFLRELPRVEQALAKPHLSYHATRELSSETLVPNFILCRSIAQALAGLTRESQQQGDTAQALHYLSLNLRWAARIREGVLMDRMVGIAMERIALHPVETMVFDSKTSTSQLRELLSLLDETAPAPLDFRNTMFLETSMLDRGLQQMANGDFRLVTSQSGDAGTRLLALIPKSYWQSERRALLNLQLSQTANWTELGPTNMSELVNALEVMPWSLSQSLLPNLTRAESQFMLSLSMFHALRLEVALELYKREHGEYPEALKALAPDYIKEVPVDPMHPNLWKHKGGFQYLRAGEGYRLLSDSPLYETIMLKTPQSYGPDGDYSSIGQ